MASTGKNEKRIGEMFDELKLSLVGAGDKGLDDIAGLLTTIDADTSGLYGAIGADDAAAKSTALSALIAKYLSTPDEADTGDAVYLVTNAFRELLIAGFQPSSGAIGVSALNWPQKTPRYSTLVSTTFAAGAAASTSSGVYIGDARQVCLMLRSVIDRTGNTPQCVWTVELSGDNSTFYPLDILMTDAGEDAPAANVTQSSAVDVTLTDFMYLPNGVKANWMRIVATPTDTDADDTIVATGIVFIHP